MAKTYEGAVNMHKLLASGASPQVEAKGKSVMPKYAKGGAVMAEGKSATLINDSSRKKALPRPAAGLEGKIATLKKGGAAKMKKGGRGC